MGINCSTEQGLCVWGRKDEDRQHLFDDISIVCTIPAFAFLEEQELSKLTAAFNTRFYEAGDTIIERGETLDNFFVVKTGKAALRPRQWPGEPEQVTELRSGDVFGVEALLRPRPSRVTVEAVEELEVWALESSAFEATGLRTRLHFQRRPAVAEGKGASSSSSLDPSSYDKTDQEYVALLEALLANRGLQPLLDRMRRKDLEAIIDSAYIYPVKAGDKLIEQGYADSGLFFMITSGTFEVISYGRQVQKLGPGESFGELGLFHRAPPAATVRALGPGTLWAVPRQSFREASRGRLRQRLAGFAAVLGRVELLKDLAEEDRDRLAEALVELRLRRGEYVTRQEEEGSEMTVLYEGEVAVDIDGHEMSRLAADPRVGRTEFFGERALVGSNRRLASAPLLSWSSLPSWAPRPRSCRPVAVRVVSQDATVLSLGRAAYERVLAGTEARPPEPVGESEGEEVHQLDPWYQDGCRAACDDADGVTEAEYSLENLEEVGLLGVGAFGSVSLVRDPATQQTLALKAVSKGLLVDACQVQAVHSEKMAMLAVHSPFLIRLAATFDAKGQLYFLMEAAMGGDLYTVYRRRCLSGSQLHARFYAACALRALEALHARHIVHRDLKPENLLLDSRGYCKLGDLGLATFTTSYACTLCGTPEYMAPEVITGAGHGPAVDWWALGVLIFECMSGESPFVAEEPSAVYRKVLLGIENAELLESPEDSESALEDAQQEAAWCNLTSQLCTPEPFERLAMRKGGASNVTAHLWFTSADFDWQTHAVGKMEAPFVPGAEDLGPLGGGFDALEREGPLRPEYNDPGTAWEAGFEKRRGHVLR